MRLTDKQLSEMGHTDDGELYGLVSELLALRARVIELENMLNIEKLEETIMSDHHTIRQLDVIFSENSWRKRMWDRYDELQAKVDDERNSLSDWRKAEAPALALTKEEMTEWRELRKLLDE